MGWARHGALSADSKAAALLGDEDRALELSIESVQAARASGNRQLVLGNVPSAPGFVHVERGELSAAMHRSESALALAHDVGWMLGIARSQNQRAHIAQRHSDHVSTVRWHAEAAVIREALATPIHPIDRPRYEADLHRPELNWDSDAYAAAWTDGRDQARKDHDLAQPVARGRQQYAEPLSACYRPLQRLGIDLEHRLWNHMWASNGWKPRLDGAKFRGFAGMGSRWRGYPTAVSAMPEVIAPGGACAVKVRTEARCNEAEEVARALADVPCLLGSVLAANTSTVQLKQAPFTVTENWRLHRSWLGRLRSSLGPLAVLP